MNDPTQDAEAEEIQRRERAKSAEHWLSPNKPQEITPGITAMLLRTEGSRAKIVFSIDPTAQIGYSVRMTT